MRSFWLILFMGGVFQGCFSESSKKPDALPTSVKVAVFSTGFDAAKPSLNAVRLSSDSWNFLGGNADLSDSSGHGTSLVHIAAKQCPSCEFVVFKTDRLTVANDAGALWVAIDRALEKGARVLLLPYAVMPTSDSLQAVLKKADEKGVLLVAAAGTGPRNPFQPEPIEKIAPQSWPSALVVTAAESLRTPDAMTNKGAAIDLLVVQPRNVPTSELAKRSVYFGSEFAAAEIAGRAAALWSREPRLNARQIRFVFREATSEAPYLYADKLGYGGGFDAAKLSEAFTSRVLKNAVAARVYVGSQFRRGFAGVDPRAVTVDINAAEKIEKVSALNWICGENKTSITVAGAVNPSHAQKGRAHLELGNPPCSPFKVKVEVKLEHIGRVTVEVSGGFDS